MLPLVRRMYDEANERHETDRARGSKEQEKRHNDRKLAYRSGRLLPDFGLLGSGSTSRTSLGVAMLSSFSVLLALSRLEGRCSGVNVPTEVPSPQRLRGEVSCSSLVFFLHEYATLYSS